MRSKYIWIGMLVIIGALVVSAFTWAGITRFNEAQRVQTQSLVSLNAADASAYRWNAMARYYQGKPVISLHIGPTNR